MKARLLPFLVVLLVLALCAGPLRADPRWWWDDLRTPYGGDPVADVDIDVDSTYSGNFRGHAWIAWVEPAAPTGPGGIWLGATFDGGCTFCDPVLVHETTGQDSTTVSIAVASLPSVYSIQIAWAENGEILVATDTTSVAEGGPGADAMCDRLQDVAVNRVIRTVSGGAGNASNPDITGDSFPGVLVHFYLAWQAGGAAGSDILFSRDLAGTGAWGPERNLTAGLGLHAFAREPSITIDFLTGQNPPRDSVANLAFHDEFALYYLKSNDSGQEFSATGEPPATIPTIVGAPRDPFEYVRRPALDSGNLQATSTPIWHGLLWEQPGDTGLFDVELPFDAKRNTDPVVMDPIWGSDHLVRTLRILPHGGPALSVFSMDRPLPGGGVPTFLFWEERDGFPTSELHYRGGVLDPSSGVDLDTFPIPPARPNDPAASENLLLTHCEYEEATGDCLPARDAAAGGYASVVAADENWTDVFVVWIDTRNGGDEIWFKRTDRDVWAQPPTLSTECVGPGQPRIVAGWPPSPNCAVAPTSSLPERLLRYRVYYGTDPGGPYLDTDLDGSDPGVEDTILVDATVWQPDPIVRRTPVLATGTTYRVIVVPEDEARNLDPPAFDPLADLPDSPFQERSIDTPDCAVPPRCLHRLKLREREPADPPPGDCFTVPDGRGITLDPAQGDVESPYVCPFGPGDAEPEAVLRGSDPLIYYQVDDTPNLRVRKDVPSGTLRLEF